MGTVTCLPGCVLFPLHLQHTSLAGVKFCQYRAGRGAQQLSSQRSLTHIQNGRRKLGLSDEVAVTGRERGRFAALWFQWGVEVDHPESY